ncbi:MAG: glycosyltransferase family 4 protein, partial [Candidatus Paceibacterota bacterium]
ENPKDCFMEALKNFKLVDKLIVPSHCSKEVLIQQGYDASSIKVIHHGINYSYLASFTNLPFLDQLLPQNQKVEIILCPARADEHKDPETFIRAASILKEKIKDQKLFFILTAKSTKMFKLEEFAKSLELQVGKGKDILIEEFKRNEMPTLYRRAKACVISSRRESFCQVVLESFLYKTPVVASNNTALKELIEHEENGMLFDTGSSNDLATQVEKILNDNGIREHIIKGGEKSLNDKYNSEIMAKNYMSLYQEVIDESQK